MDTSSVSPGLCDEASARSTYPVAPENFIRADSRNEAESAALAGAALGSVAGHAGTGAAVGAGTGLVAGSAVGTGNAAAAGGSLQARYDTVYAQCMSAKGNRIPAPPVVGPMYVYPHSYY